MSKTIRKNQQKKARIIFGNAQNIKVYTLDNGFTGKPANREDYQGENWLLKEWNAFNSARLTQQEDNKKMYKYCLRIHSNCWYDFTN